ncbi:hypothetical protein AXF42_Ash003201 [Apostasia shenzhenica]|uniref:Uncharacterized protein n=1 Tax=Apostasia shenzhenica TaxID=1088818 RepID=A0A2I0BFF9_9ASPA|nr:hypothetical protein AXF42_Ash003201 [Apostasia shenzhenica]
MTLQQVRFQKKKLGHRLAPGTERENKKQQESRRSGREDKSAIYLNKNMYNKKNSPQPSQKVVAAGEAPRRPAYQSRTPPPSPRLVRCHHPAARSREKIQPLAQESRATVSDSAVSALNPGSLLGANAPLFRFSPSSSSRAHRITKLSFLQLLSFPLPTPLFFLSRRRPSKPASGGRGRNWLSPPRSSFTLESGSRSSTAGAIPPLVSILSNFSTLRSNGAGRRRSVVFYFLLKAPLLVYAVSPAVAISSATLTLYRRSAKYISKDWNSEVLNCKVKSNEQEKDLRLFGTITPEDLLQKSTKIEKSITRSGNDQTSSRVRANEGIIIPRLLGRGKRPNVLTVGILEQKKTGSMYEGLSSKYCHVRRHPVKRMVHTDNRGQIVISVDHRVINLQNPNESEGKL